MNLILQEIGKAVRQELGQQEPKFSSMSHNLYDDLIHLSQRRDQDPDSWEWLLRKAHTAAMRALYQLPIRDLYEMAVLGNVKALWSLPSPYQDNHDCRRKLVAHASKRILQRIIR